MTSRGKTAPSLRNPPAPLALAAVTFGAGVWLAGHLHKPVWTWGLAAAVLIACAIAAVYVKNIRLGYLSVAGALICAGAFLRLGTPAQQLSSPPDEFLTGAQVEIEGHVTDDGSLLAGSEPRERFDLETEVIRIGEKKFTQPIGIRATVFLKQSASNDEDDSEAAGGFPQVVYGNRVKLIGKLRPPRSFRNPGAFDYESYLRSLGITALVSVRA